MAEMMIAFRQPGSLTPRLMDAWLTDAARERASALDLSRAEPADGDELFLRVRLHEHDSEAAEQELSGLLREMRLLGFCPAVIEHAR